ncbi:hypothetical protein [Nodularia spumigena]|uniref:hypothetical protein n=1 Tax=Nodularia spumigena TaxID=70799 RepID=UPI002B21796A|nr:hypothetical protein [Nodularia spumigena]MEA5557580.1 hypothetical protein [Nodularia spumigena CH309]
MKRLFTLAALASFAGLAAGGGLDITVLNSGGILTTGLIDEDTLEITPGVRVFAGDFSEFGGIVFGDEPGIDIIDGSFTPGAQLLLNVRKSLRLWNGTDFNSLTTNSITLEFGPQTLTSPGTDTPAGPMIFDFDANGGLHDHPDFVLNNNEIGLYLLEIEFAKDGFGTSLPAWIVFNYGFDEVDHDLAIDWVQDNLVPTPGAAAILALGLGTLTRRRR